MSEETEESIKADPLGGIIPQEIITGDILRGYGPRRGNLERLLRYWRPIMRKPGGFRRCRVILANHPELYPLNNICAWLHHETTGLWPNEGCHHPGMKNCKRKLKNWTNAEFSRHLSRAARRAVKKKSEDVFFHNFKSEKFDPETNVVTESDFDHAMTVLSDFAQMEERFVKYLQDDKNWEMEGEDEEGNMKSMPIKTETKSEGCCG